MTCIRDPWLLAFDEMTCRRGYEKGGYHPYTRLPMVKLMLEQEARKSTKEDMLKRRKISKDTAQLVSGLSISEVMDRINNADPAWKRLPDPQSVTSKTKISKATLAEMEISPSSKDAIRILELKEAAQEQDAQAKKARAEQREQNLHVRVERGHELFKVVSDTIGRQLESLTVQELDDLAAYKALKWTMPDGSVATRKAENIMLLRMKHPFNFPALVPTQPLQPAEVEPPAIEPPTVVTDTLPSEVTAASS